MSGIAGIFNLDGQPVDGQALRAMTGVVAYRGPDGIGHWTQGPVGLGHLQLAATPESYREQQPLVSADGNYAIVFDGRIDNRQELVRDLGSLASASSEATDVELVLHAYTAWGVGCAKHIVGDFAFAIWDNPRQQLFCARDPVGVRLFNYYFDGQRFIFGTEIKQIFQHGDIPKRLNEVMLGLYLCGNFGDGEMTFYSGINRLKGGCSLVVSRRGLSKQVFWNPDPGQEIRYKRETEYTDHLRELLFETVRCRLRSTTPVGILTSGGLDSGSVASAAGYLRQCYPETIPELRAYYWRYENPPLDETPYLEAVTRRYRLPVTAISMDNLWAMKPVASAAMTDGPYGIHFEAMNQRGLEVAHQQGVRVLLTGEGGDEAFSYGYMLYLRDWLLGLRLPTLWRDLRNATPAYRQDAQRFLRRGLIPPRMRHWLGRTRGSVPIWVDSGFARRLRLAERLQAVQVYRYRDSDYVQTRGSNPMLIGGDQRSTSYGIEVRHPLWDSRLVEFMVRVPAGVRVQGGRTKLFLKKAMRGILPDEVLQRMPHGAFGPLLSRGFRQHEAPRLEKLIRDSQLQALGAINGDEFLTVYQAYQQGDDSKFSRLYWTFATEEWLQQSWPELQDASHQQQVYGPVRASAGKKG